MRRTVLNISEANMTRTLRKHADRAENSNMQITVRMILSLNQHNVTH